MNRLDIDNQSGKQLEDIARIDVSDTVTVNGLKYIIDNNTGEAMVIDGKDLYGSDITVRVPDSISIAGKTYKVTSIGFAAFAGNKYIASVIISDTVTRISSSAFSRCERLTSVSIPGSIIEIGEYAFLECFNLSRVEISNVAAWCKIDFGYYANPLIYGHNLYFTGENDPIVELDIPDGVKEIKDYVFEGCYSINKITIPASIVRIGKECFSHCINLGKVYISNMATWCNIEFEFGANPLKYAHNLYLVGAKKTITDLEIPDKVTNIKDYAFEGCTSLTSVRFPDSIKQIGKGAFSKCFGLNAVFISNISSWCNIDFDTDDNLIFDSNPLKYAHNLYVGGVLVENLEIPDGLPGEPEQIKQGTFFGCQSIKSLSIKNSPKRIGRYSFYECINLEAMSIPDSVISIGDYACAGCSGLKSIHIGDSVVEIGSNAFAECTGLSSMGILQSVTKIGSGAFYGCNSLVSITIPNSVSSITDYVFCGCSSLNSIDLGDCVTSIGIGAFSGCTALKSLMLPDSVKSIGKSAFEGCGSLTKLTLPNQVNIIHEYAFSDCYKLESITIPDSVTKIGDYAFADCIGLKGVYISSILNWCKIEFGIDSNPLKYANSLYINNSLVIDLIIPYGVKKIIQRAFQGCGISSVLIPASVTTIESDAFANCRYLNNITISSSVKNIESGAFAGCVMLQVVEIPDSVMEIAAGAFEGCSGLKSVTVGDSVAVIGRLAFSGCSCMNSITIGSAVRFIGDYAFLGCNSLTSVKIADVNSWCEIDFEGIESNPLKYARKLYDLEGKAYLHIYIDGRIERIKRYAFINCDGFSGVTIPNTVTEIEECAFYGCSGLIRVATGSAVKTIGNRAFEGCSSMTSVTISISTTKIGDFAFYGCTSLNKIHISDVGAWCGIDFGEGANPLQYGRHLYLDGTEIIDLVIPDIEKISSRAFYNCRSMETVRIPSCVNTIGEDAFFQCVGLKKVLIYDIAKWCDINFGYSGNGSFESNPLLYAHRLYHDDQQIIDLVIPQGVEILKKGTFCGCNTLTSVYLPDSLTSIGDYSFCDCSKLSKLQIPDYVTAIGSNAFNGCRSMKSVIIPPSVKSIGAFAFYGCTDLNVVTITDIAAWCGIDFLGNRSNPLGYAPNLFQSIENIVRPIVNLEIPESVSKIKNNAFRGYAKLKSVIIHDSVTEIGTNAFEGCAALETLYLGESVSLIGNHAFSNCVKLWSLITSDSTNTIGEYAFCNCANMNYVTILPSVSKIGKGAFCRCDNLAYVNIYDVAAWCNIDFESADSNPLRCATQLSLVRDLMYIPVRNLDIPVGVTQVNRYAFRGCGSIEAVTIPATVSSLGDFALYCDNLWQVFCNVKKPIEIPENSFKNFSGTLNVPEESVESYTQTPVWGKFKTIE